MAKNELQVNLEGFEDETTEQQTTAQSNDGVTVNEDNIEQEAPEKRRVKIRVRKPHRCSIGGVWYDLHPGKEYPVPVHVRDILRNAKLLEG